MSIRTIIEINHDYLAALEKPEALEMLWRALRSQGHFQPPNGVRILGQRHHSETLKLEVK